MTRDVAQQILELEFDEDDRERMHSLAVKNQRSELTEDEAAELDHYCRVGTLLSILKVRARQTLKSRTGTGKP